MTKVKIELSDGAVKKNKLLGAALNAGAWLRLNNVHYMNEMSANLSFKRKAAGQAKQADLKKTLVNNNPIT